MAFHSCYTYDKIFSENDIFYSTKRYELEYYAKNINRIDSDIDVAIVVKKIEGDYFEIQPLLWKLRRQIDDRIEPVLIEKDNDISGLLIDIQRNGIEIA